MRTSTYYAIGFLMIAAVLALTGLAYPRLPQVVPTHWNAHGAVNGYSPKWTLFLTTPGAMALIMLVFSLLPVLSPKRFEVDSFRSTYLYIMVMIVALLGYIHGLVLWAGLTNGGGINLMRGILGGGCLLFALLGNVLGKVRRNFYVGVRTPWTLANEHVWNATHRFAAKTFFCGGLAGLALLLVGVAFQAALIALLVAGLAPVVYSLVIYKRLERRGEA